MDDRLDISIPAKKGRKRKFTTEQLKNIILEYSKTKPRLISYKKTDLCEFANNYMNLEHIVIPHDFGRNTEIKKYIEDLNEEITLPKKLISQDLVGFVNYEMDVDDLVNSRIKDKKGLKQILNAFNKNTNVLKKEYSILENRYDKLSNQYDEALKEVERLKSRNDKYKSDKKELENKLENYRSNIFSKDRRMVETINYLYSKGCCSELTENDIVRILEQHFKIDRAVYDSSNYINYDELYDLSDVNIGKSGLDIENVENTKILNFEEHKFAKERELDTEEVIYNDEFEDDDFL